MERQQETLENFIKEFEISNAKIELFENHNSEDTQKWDQFFNDKGLSKSEDSKYLIFVGNDTSGAKSFPGYTLLKSDNQVYVFQKDSTEESPEKKRKREESEELEKKRKVDEEKEIEIPKEDKTEEGETKQDEVKQDENKEMKDPIQEKTAELDKVRTAEHSDGAPRTKEEGEKVLHDQ